MQKPFYTGREAARIVGTSHTEIYRMIRRGELPAISMGRAAWLIAAEDVEALKRSREN